MTDKFVKNHFGVRNDQQPFQTLKNTHYRQRTHAPNAVLD